MKINDRKLICEDKVAEISLKDSYLELDFDIEHKAGIIQLRAGNQMGF